MTRLWVPVQARVNVRTEVFDVRTGALRARDHCHNLVVDAGLDQLRDYLYGVTAPALSHAAVGTDGTATAAADTALRAEVFRDVLAQRARSPQALTVRLVLGSQHANGATLREVGLFNDPTAGTLYARVTPAPVDKTDEISVVYTWTLAFEPDEEAS